MIPAASNQFRIIRTPGKVYNMSSVIVQPMSDFPSSGIVNHDRVGGSTRCEIPTIVGEFHDPDFSLGLIQHMSRPEGKLVSIAHMICEE